MIKQSQHEYQYGNRKIIYTLFKKNVKGITIKVKPSEEVIITAPIKITREHLKSLLEKRADWISSKLSFYEELNSNKSRKIYAHGFSHRYLGRNYRLKVFKDSNKEFVRFYRGYIEIYLKNETTLYYKEDIGTKESKTKGIISNLEYKEKVLEEKIEKLLNIWHLERSKEKFIELYSKVIPKFKGYNIENPKIKIRKMKSRWGSYTPSSNTILLNSELIKTSLACIEYVIIHEIVHILHLDHSKRFYSTLATILPDWEERKKLLEKEGIEI